MSPKDALNIVDQAISQLNASRQVHVQLQQAVTVLQGVVASADIKQPEEPKE